MTDHHHPEFEDLYDLVGREHVRAEIRHAEVMGRLAHIERLLTRLLPSRNGDPDS